MAELADALDLESSPFEGAGSSPVSGIAYKSRLLANQIKLVSEIFLPVPSKIANVPPDCSLFITCLLQNLFLNLTWFVPLYPLGFFPDERRYWQLLQNSSEPVPRKGQNFF